MRNQPKIKQGIPHMSHSRTRSQGQRKSTDDQATEYNENIVKAMWQNHLNHIRAAAICVVLGLSCSALVRNELVPAANLVAVLLGISGVKVWAKISGQNFEPATEKVLWCLIFLLIASCVFASLYPYLTNSGFDFDQNFS